MKISNSEVGIVYMSGYLEYEKGNGEFLEEGIFLQKPFSREDLVSKVDEALRSERNKRPCHGPMVPSRSFY
jgi:two-component SAPR family response regulator